MSMANNTQAPTWLDLYDFRRRVERIYRTRNKALRAGKDEQSTLNEFRAAKDKLFAEHPQSAVDPAQRGAFQGLRYFPYNPDLRVEGVLQPLADEHTADDEAASFNPTPLRPAAQLLFQLENTDLQLQVYWIDVYGGSLFLPFRDLTSGDATYGGGRYLFDTAKGSDFLQIAYPSGKKQIGYAGGRVVIDFNYAYNPSCVYDARWSCPLAPRENWLKVAIKAGEMQFNG